MRGGYLPRYMDQLPAHGASPLPLDETPEAISALKKRGAFRMEVCLESQPRSKYATISHEH